MTKPKACDDQVFEILLSDIDPRFEWNSRSGKWMEDSGDEESQNFSDFMASIESQGQKTPAIVRAIKCGQKPYELLAGFRRYMALTKIAEKLGRKAPTMRVVIQNCDGVDARLENLSENSNRQNVSTPDLAWGIWDAIVTAKHNRRELSQSEVARRLGLSQSYVVKLVAIMRDCKPNITKRWRESAVKISVMSMVGISKLAKSEQEAAFAQLLGVKLLKDTDDDVKRTTWVETTKKKAFNVGSILGRLEREGLIDTSKLDFETHADLCVPINDKATYNQRRSIAACLNRGYKTALDAEDQLITEEEDGA